jgi:hypothetical protein
MPPRRGARVEAVVECATTALTSLPLPILLQIFALLPVDTRLRCAEVCRGWRSVLLERSLWKRLDLFATSGVHTNSGTLRELHAHDNKPYRGVDVDKVAVLCAAAPLLHTFVADVRFNIPDMNQDDANLQTVRRALRNEAPFGPLRVARLDVDVRYNENTLALVADVATHATLTELVLTAPLRVPECINAVVNAALARRLQTVTLKNCFLCPASAPALARLLGSDALTTLELLLRRAEQLLDTPAARVLAAALRANSTLTSLTLDNAGVWHDPDAAAELLGALHGHASLQVLHLQSNLVAAAHQAASCGRFPRCTRRCKCAVAHAVGRVVVHPG